MGAHPQIVTTPGYMSIERAIVAKHSCTSINKHGVRQRSQHHGLNDPHMRIKSEWQKIGVCDTVSTGLGESYVWVGTKGAQ